MAWVRIHDGAMSHPKIVGLIDWRNPFCLWVWGLSYCQQHLTDGLIVKDAVPNRDALKTAARLVSKRLWLDEGAAFRVHDYLDWNNSREFVDAERQRAKERARSSRGRAAHVQRTSSIGVDVGVPLGDCSSEGVQGEPLPVPVPAPISVAVARPRSSGKQAGRLFLHRWQLDELIATLGPHAAGFGLDEWIDGLSQRATVLPMDRWKWVQSELHAEVLRRGLPVAEATSTAPTNKRIAGLMAGGEAFLRRVAESEAR